MLPGSRGSAGILTGMFRAKVDQILDLDSDVDGRRRPDDLYHFDNTVSGVVYSVDRYALFAAVQHGFGRRVRDFRW